MGIFTRNFDKPGPGIPKDLPPKKGFDLFGSIFKREFWNLIKLNLIFILFSIPIVTIGSSYAALTKVTTKMIWDENIYAFSDFYEAFKSEFKRTLPIGIALLAIMFLIFFSGMFYLQASAENQTFYIIFLFLCFVSLIICLSLVFLFPLLVSIDLPVLATIKNSFILGIVCIKQSLPCVLLELAIWFVMYLYFPLSLPIIIVFTVAFISLINSFAAWPGIKKYVAVDAALEEKVEIE